MEPVEMVNDKEKENSFKIKEIVYSGWLFEKIVAVTDMFRNSRCYKIHLVAVLTNHHCNILNNIMQFL